ncbi:MAG: ribosome biogenesis GTP-binding protein YsxC, partial [Ruminococcus sp.]|nr:ribosome biogenesis GTP-binding protein YsxC [Candidatus Apopatosoma intestinale]
MALTIQNVILKMTAGRVDQFPRDTLPQIALSGRSNVGKSSLINTVLGRKSLARTSSAPGKTITVNFYEVDKKLYLVDLPGYGYAKRSAEDQKKWSFLTESYIAGERKPALVFQLIDLKVGPTKDDYMMLDWLATSGLRYIVIAT